MDLAGLSSLKTVLFGSTQHVCMYVCIHVIVHTHTLGGQINLIIKLMVVIGDSDNTPVIVPMMMDGPCLLACPQYPTPCLVSANISHVKEKREKRGEKHAAHVRSIRFQRAPNRL